MSKEKKAKQLGMNPSTAQHALRKQLMFHLTQKCGMDNCFQCGEPIETVEDFSIEHKVPWLDSEDPVKMFFDLTNVAFSHISCNVKAARRSKAPCGTVTCYKNGCRCDLCRKAKANSRFYCPERRKQQYHKHGT